MDAGGVAYNSQKSKGKFGYAAKKIAKHPPSTDDFEVQENFNALTVTEQNFKTGGKRGLNSTVAIKQKYRRSERKKRGK